MMNSLLPDGFRLVPSWIKRPPGTFTTKGQIAPERGRRGPGTGLRLNGRGA